MEVKFEIINYLDEEAARAFARVNRNKHHWFRYLIAVLWIALAVGYWMLFHFVLVSLAFGLFGVYRLYQAICWDRIVGKKILKNANSKAGEGRYSFTDEYVYSVDSLEENKIQYARFVDLVESDGYYFLYIGKGLAHILPKTGFTHGNPAEFAAFISEKTGIEVKKVKG